MKKPPKNEDVQNSFTVVGIGASAGGLEALSLFFDNVSAQSGIAYVVVQHLDPTKESLMAELLAHHANLPVTQVTERTLLRPDHVYVMPPNRDLSVDNGALVLTKQVELRGQRLPIDCLFQSMAEQLESRAVCLVLSGTGADGSLGLKLVKQHGGLVMVQDPSTAAHDGMPRNAISSGMADLVLAVEMMPEALVRHATQTHAQGSKQKGLANEDVDSGLPSILAIIQTRLNQDFSAYKKSTLTRRIERRMGLLQLDKRADYLEFLRHHKDEIGLLAKDFLISVTQFFRDPESFEALARETGKSLARGQNTNLPIRVWVAGCATGEEAYSLGMLLIEQLGSDWPARGLQVFGTDIDAEALHVARTGLYSEDIKTDVSPQRLRRFFTKEVGGYRINQQLRSCITFAQQNLLSDPPFSRLHLISCRNLLIYIEPEMQADIIPLLHYGLLPGQYLFLGSSESIGTHNDLFNTLDSKARVYQHIDIGRNRKVSIPTLLNTGSKSLEPLGKDSVNTLSTGLVEIAHNLLAQEFAPPSLIIDNKDQPLYFFGSVDRYLRLTTGVPTQPVTDMAREGLRSVLRRLIKQVRQSGEIERTHPVPVKFNEEIVQVTVEVRPTTVSKNAEGPLILSFIEQTASQVQQTKAQSPMLDQDGTIGELEDELRATHRSLQIGAEEAEIASEEMKVSNEEAMSMNEELQSTNEELATSKEEMQSLNEELSTANLALQQRSLDLEDANDDLVNLLNSTDVATLFLDKNLLIGRFTASIPPLINLMPADTGRPITDFSMNFIDPRMIPDAQAVLDRLIPIEREIEGSEGKWYIRNISPFRTQTDKIEGVVITFVDITQRKQGEDDLRRLAAVVRDSNDAITVQDLKGNILEWNRGAELMYGYTKAEALSMNMIALVPQASRDEARALLDNLSAGKEVESFETKRVTKDGRVLDVWMIATFIRDEANGETAAFATTERDLTILHQVEARAEGNKRLAAIGQVTGGIAHDFNNLLAVVMGNSELLEDELGSENKLLRDIRHAVERAAELTQRLLAYSRRQPLRPETFDVGALISEISPLIERTLGEHVVVSTVIAPDLWRGLADSGQVESALLNLAINARDAMPSGGQLTIECSNARLDEAFAAQNPEIEAGDYVVLSLKDTGTGMPPDVREKVFEPFFTTKDVGKGSGLGLSMVFGFAKQSGGQVTIESEEAQGTNVRLYLRRSSHSLSSKEKASEDGILTGRGELLLVVEDDLGVRDLTVNMLKGLGYRVVEAAEAKSAQTVLDHEKIDLVLTDIVLPGGVHGPEIARKARQINPDIKVIFMSGHPREVSKKQDALVAGSVLLNKPFRRIDLAKIVSEALAN